MKTIFAINGSASENSANQKLIEHISNLTKGDFEFVMFNDLKNLPHFDPAISIGNTPKIISDFRAAIAKADGILICTPEYVFSIPSGLKNALEWCVSTTVFSEKATGIITASAQGEKGQEELQLIMKTLMARFTDETTLLIQGIKGKINDKGKIADPKTNNDLERFIEAFKKLVSG